MPQREPSQPVAAPRRFPLRRMLQYRLRTLLVITTIIAVLFGWWSYKAQRQREAVAALRKIGGTAYYHRYLPWTSENYDSPKWPPWVLDTVVADYLARVQVIRLNSTTVTDDDLKFLKNMPALEELQLNNTDITDVSLQHLEDLTALHTLWLDNTRVSDAGLKHLTGLTALIWLDVRNTQISDTGLEHLRNLTALKAIRLSQTKVTPAGMSRLKQSLPNCSIIIDRPPP
ncbi:MAG: hypothetical protein K8T91_26025 [Planctomycetes bacterium]|nr:hypothetical protein [Planctomycetota bacterium]